MVANFTMAFILALQSNEALTSHRRCGVNALVQAARLAGTTIKIEQAEAELIDAGDAVDLAKIRGVLESRGLHCRGVRLAPQEIPCIPAIIAVRRQPKLPLHYVVLFGTTKSKIQVIDYPMPPRWVEIDELARVWDGAALLVAADGRQLKELAIGKSLWSGVLLAVAGAVLIAFVWWNHAKKYRPTIPGK